MKHNTEIKGLWAPIVTPFFEGRFDKDSLAKLIRKIEPDVDGFVPCLSSGEGDKMSEEVWTEVIKAVKENTSKPVAAGILRSDMQEIIDFSRKAESLGCIAVAIPLQGGDAANQKDFCREISDRSMLPILLYNTEKIHIDDLSLLKEIDISSNIISLKDSSQNQEFFNKAADARKRGEIGMSILQGMENQLLESAGCDGFLVSLANLEPKLCRDILERPSEELKAQIMSKWDEFGLASETWYKGIKQALFSRGIIKSAEPIQ